MTDVPCVVCKNKAVVARNNVGTAYIQCDVCGCDVSFTNIQDDIDITDEEFAEEVSKQYNLDIDTHICKTFHVPYGHCTVFLEGVWSGDVEITKENNGVTIEILDEKFDCMKPVN